MKGTIRIRVTPQREGVERIRTAINLKDIDALGKARLLKSFLKGLEISFAEAELYISMLRIEEANNAKEDQHE